MASKKNAAPKGAANPNVSADEAPADILRKITPRHIMEMDIAKFLRDEAAEATEAKRKPADSLHLFNVYGIANGTKSGSTTYGPWEALTGAFEAVRIDGRRFQAGVCFLPNPTGEMLIGALKAQREADSDASVRFALAIGVKRIVKRDGTDGYEFTARQIVKIEQADPLSDLRTKALAFEGAGS